MKNSMKYFWAVVAAIVVLLVVLTLIFRGIVSEHIVIDKPSSSGNIIFENRSGSIVEKEFDLSGFAELKITGGWDVLVLPSEEYSVTVRFNESNEQDYYVDTTGDTLNLSMKSFGRSNKGASATIYMPDLKFVKVDGAVNLNLEEFKMSEFELRLDGAGNIYGEDCEIDRLTLDANGALNVDFTKSDIKNAHIQLDGAGNVQLNMTGGNLTGRMGGLSRLEYTGTVDLIDVEKDGMGNIKHRD